MSGEILLKAADARSRGELRHLRGAGRAGFVQVAEEQAGPAGRRVPRQTADAWDTKYTDWDKSAHDLMDALDGLGKFLNSAADAIEETDNKLAGQLG